MNCLVMMKRRKRTWTRMKSKIKGVMSREVCNNRYKLDHRKLYKPRDIDYHPVLLDNGVDGSGTLVLTYRDFNVTILCSKIAQATIPSEIHGEDGTLTIDHIAPIQKLSFYNRKKKDRRSEERRVGDERRYQIKMWCL